MSQLFPATLIRQVRLVRVGGVAAPPGVVDVRVEGGLVTAVGPALPEAGAEVFHGGGRWAIPGLWDQHVHLGQWVDTMSRLDTSGTTSPEAVLDRVRAEVGRRTDRGSVVVGFGHRSALWTRQPTVAELDRASAGHPVVLVSGDVHSGWLNTAALRLLGVGETSGPLTENEWFSVFGRLHELRVAPAGPRAWREAVARASALGIVGIGDFDFTGLRDWPDRFSAGIQGLRVRAAFYPDVLGDIAASGVRSGHDLLADRGGSGGLIEVGPLKIISDGSLNTRSAFCHDEYISDADRGPASGWPNQTRQELHDLFVRGRDAGFRMAIHAIGDAAVGRALDLFAATGARGGIEHAQLMTTADVSRMGRLGLTASVQPAHLLDDRDVTERSWSDRADRVYRFRDLLDAGVDLRLGSDAPVSPLDPWLAMAAAVHRSADERDPWHPEQAISVDEALAASTDGQRTIAPGNRGDVVLLDADPLAPTPSSADADRLLRTMPVAMTFLGGRVTNQA